MRKFLTIFLPVFSLIIFVLLMIGAPFLKKPWGMDDKVMEYVDNTIKYASEEQWDKAKSEVEKIENGWSKVIKRVQYASELGEVDDIYNNIARVRGGVQAKDKGIVLSSLYEIKENWKGLGE